MKTDIGLGEDAIKGVAHILNANLCDEYVLTTKTRNYHWNATGPQFYALHKFLEEQYEQLDEIVDELAERVRALGQWAFGTLTEFCAKTKLEEVPGYHPDAAAMLSELAADHASVIRSLRGDIATCEKKYRDSGSANFLTELLERHEKMAWMLRAHSRGGKKEPARTAAGGRRSGPLDLTDDASGAGQ